MKPVVTKRDRAISIALGKNPPKITKSKSRIQKEDLASKIKNLRELSASLYDELKSIIDDRDYYKELYEKMKNKTDSIEAQLAKEIALSALKSRSRIES